MIENISEKLLRERIENPVIGSYPPPNEIGGAVSSAKNIKLTKDSDVTDILEQCNRYWLALEPMRGERSRNVRYKNGDQWSDFVEDPDRKGFYISEKALMSRQGKSPLKHNFIQQFVRNITGQMLSNPTQSVVHARSNEDIDLGEMLTNTLQACHSRNMCSKLDIAVLEELLLSGLGCVKLRYDYWSERDCCDGRIDLVNTNRLFFNTDIEDPRLTDIRLIGQLHDYTIDQMVSYFASSPEEETYIRNRYGSSVSNMSVSSALGEKLSSISFFNSTDNDKCRVVEVWHRVGHWVSYVHDYADGSFTETTLDDKKIATINNRRIESAKKMDLDVERVPKLTLTRKYEYYWQVKFIASDGKLLRDTSSPYTHGSHPYSIASMPAVDGQFRGVISDIVDIQRYINRLIVTIDFIMSSSAKGVLMVPETAIPDGCSVDDFASQYVKTNGIIVYRPQPGRETPYQISQNSTNIGAWDMLSTQLNFIQQISGLSGAIQGQRAASNTPSSLYAQESANSQLNYSSLMEALSSFKNKRDEKLLKILMQYYTEPRHLQISGRNFKSVNVIYEPDMASKIVDFNMVVDQSIDTPVFRELNDNLLRDMLNSGYIGFDTYLENSAVPLADKLRRRIIEKNRLAEMFAAKNDVEKESKEISKKSKNTKENTK